MKDLVLGTPSAKQWEFLREQRRYVAFGGARGGGKSWAVRTKAVLLALRYAGIRIAIVRKSYPELTNNHINQLRAMTAGVAKYSDREKALRFRNGSAICFVYCERDRDLDRLQGVEYDVIFIDEATQFSEYQISVIRACVRGVNDFPKRMYLTCNPGGPGHAYIKRLFVDRRFRRGEDPEEYAFIQSRASDNPALMAADPGYVKRLEALPPKKRRAWLDGDWDSFEGAFFEEFTDDPAHYRDRRFTHVIDPIPVREMQLYRSYDFGYAKPFSCAWWGVDRGGVIYRILELYGCSGEPDEGVRWTPDRQFTEIARVEREHPYLKGRTVTGVADPSIWDGSRGESVAETAARHGIYFTPGENERLPGWMQCHYRLAFDENGYPMMYVFSTCKAFIRTIPLLTYSQTRSEDLDTSQEDHAADEWRYFCMSRPIAPPAPAQERPLCDDPLNMLADRDRR